MYFKYGIEEIEHLKNNDKLLGEAIDKIGPIQRPLNKDLFSSLIHLIIGQQISTIAQKTIWERLLVRIGEVNVKNICSLNREELQKLGMTFRKSDYIKSFADKVFSNEFDINTLNTMTDEEVIKKLSTLKGIGPWTAEMLLIFCMQRPNVISFGDLAILRGMRMLYQYQEIDKVEFKKLSKVYSPYSTVASLYLWAIAGGAIPELSDPAPKKTKKI